MILERSKTESVLSTSSSPKSTIVFMKDFVQNVPSTRRAKKGEKPSSSSGFPRLSKNSLVDNTSANITVEALPSASTITPTTTQAVIDTGKPANVSAAGLTVKTHQVGDDGTSGITYPFGSHPPLLNRRSRAMVTFHCSPFDTGAVRVAVSAQAPPPENRAAATLIHSTPYGWVPPIITAAPELPSRLEPIHPLPPAPQRQYTNWETVDGHWRNDQRAAIMRRLQHINSNEMLAKMYYGTSQEINDYKKHMRHILKQQMEEQWVKSRKRFHLDLSESNAAIEYDRECLREDQRADWQKRMYLRQFAFDNRKLADERRQHQVQERSRELDQERRLLAYNPINWSGTLT